jgi:hypothetical protein
MNHAVDVRRCRTSGAWQLAGGQDGVRYCRDGASRRCTEPELCDGVETLELFRALRASTSWDYCKCDNDIDLTVQCFGGEGL